MKRNFIIALLCTAFCITISACASQPDHEHVFGSSWQYDNAEHWRTCVECGEDVRSEHSYYQGVCRMCGYKSEISLDMAYEGVYDGETLVSYVLSGLGDCKDNSLNIPAEHNSLPVTAIKAEAFKGKTSLTSVTIPSSVEIIGDYAFQACSNLKNLTISGGVREIGKNAFSSCAKLEKAFIPNSVTVLGEHAFSACTGLVDLTISGGITSIKGGTFMSCSSLISVKIPDGVETIAALAFQNCFKIVSVEFGKNVKSIDEQAFQNCQKLQTLKVAEDNQTFKGAGNCVISRFDETLVLGGSAAVVPHGVKAIGNFAFFQRVALTEIYLPSSLESVGASAFTGCNGISAVYYSGSAAQWGEISFGGGNDSLLESDKIFGVNY